LQNEHGETGETIRRFCKIVGVQNETP
jgi:hypothetical protein